MKLCITAGNYHIFKLMIKNHKDSRIQLKNIHSLDFDLVFDVYTSLDQKTVISILSHELRYSPFMYLCPGFKVEMSPIPKLMHKKSSSCLLLSNKSEENSFNSCISLSKFKYILSKISFSFILAKVISSFFFVNIIIIFSYSFFRIIFKFFFILYQTNNCCYNSYPTRN